jgi:lipoprotein-anchoring transpeptidase ErfK/SrfK
MKHYSNPILQTLFSMFLLNFAFSEAFASSNVGVSYLEQLGKPGVLSKNVSYLPPSKIDPAYSHAVYVNVARSGPRAQKMWVIKRAGKSWRLAKWDKSYWSKSGKKPQYSWPISSGKKYPGDSRSGPTPVGIFNPDDRNPRHRKGWGSPGMYNSIYLDLHYSSGRASGIAMHGTTNRMYSRLGTIDSHGCIRMKKANSQIVWDMFHPDGAMREKSPLWGNVPRFFKSDPAASTRRGYVRDGSVRFDGNGNKLMKPGYKVLFVFFRDDI